MVAIILGKSPRNGHSQEPTPDPHQRFISLMMKNCQECHTGSEPAGGLSFETLPDEATIADQRATWEKVQSRIHTGQMPPKESEPLLIEDRQFLANYLPEVFRRIACEKGAQPGPFRLRRLNRYQYSNTIRDLLQVHYDAGYALPQDGAGGEGFDNAAETLFLSAIHGEKYLEAAKEALNYAFKNQTSRNLTLVSLPGPEKPDDVAAREVLQRFASRAFRRPATESDVNKLLKLYEFAKTERALPFDEAVFYAMQSCLISPNFLFMMEQSTTKDQPQDCSPHEFATRLSYFLWDSMPDGDLLRLANEGKLSDPAVIEEQVKRMLRDDDRLTGMLDSFMGQWLGTRDLGRSLKMDAEIFPEMNDELAEAFRKEPVRLMQHILMQNRSLTELIDSDYAFVNDRTIHFYDIPRKGLDLNQNLKKVDLPEDSLRGGLVTMGGSLAVSSFPTRTSPVLRGKWILEKLLNAPPPPPPPNVPPLSDERDDRIGKTLRQRLEIHRANPTCASCHDLLDPLGFGLESFDAIGRKRAQDNGIEVDDAGKLPTGESFKGAKELKKILMDRKEQVMRAVVTRMMAYALGRSLVDSDYCEIDRIFDRLKSDDYHGQTLILEIVRSVPFRQRGWIEE